jgi:adenylosuccinate lyase
MNIERGVFDDLSVLDYRYWSPKLSEYLSEHAFVQYKLKVEAMLVRVLCKRGVCSADIAEEIWQACLSVTVGEVYEEEKKTKHDIRALVHCIQKRVSDVAKPFVHLTATSYDIIETANAMRYMDVVTRVLRPGLSDLMGVLITIVEREADTLQIGRTHGQHAVPITFGFAIAQYVSRLGELVQKLFSCTIHGKFSGAVGAYNASSLFFDDPVVFENEIVGALGLDEPYEIATQIAPPECLVRLLSEATMIAGVLANLADDMRQLQRTEISEVGEHFAEGQVGSSTMPQKQNPVTFENVKSMWKIVVARMQTVYMDQISEHQRDLTGSASGRTFPEIICYVAVMVSRMTHALKGLRVDRERMQHNFRISRNVVAGEGLQVLLSAYGCLDAHKKVQALTVEAKQKDVSIYVLAWNNGELVPYLEKFSVRQRDALQHPEMYTGIASQRARAVVVHWKGWFDEGGG